jgi:hypothetical protein
MNTEIALNIPDELARQVVLAGGSGYRAKGPQEL